MENGSNNEAIKTEQEANNGQNVADWKDFSKTIAQYARLIEVLSLAYEEENSEYLNTALENTILTLSFEISDCLFRMREKRGQK